MAEEANGLVDGLGEEARNRKSWSDVWAHFERFVGADGRQRARCKKCPAKLLADPRNGTTRLWRHARDTCPGNDSAPEQHVQDARGSHKKRPRSLPLVAAPPGTSKLVVEEANADLARMVAFHGYHPSFVEDRYFRSLVGRLNPDFQVPSRFAIQDMCDGILEEALRNFRSEMERTSSKFSLAVDTVKTNEGTALYFACHFIDDEWNLRKMIVGQYRVVTRRAWKFRALGIFELCLDDEDDYSWLPRYLELDKPFSMTVEKKGNLMGRLDLMKVFRYPQESTFVDVVLHSVAQCLFDNLAPHIPSDVGSEVLGAGDREEFLSKLGIDDLRPYDQQWFLLYCSLQFLHKYGSTTSDFEELLTKLWGEIYRAIKTVSDPSLPTSHLCLVELFKVRDLLQIELTRASGDTPRIYEDNGFEKDVEHVLQLARDELDSRIEDSYRELSLPLVLDPRYKLRYINFSFPRVFGTEVAADNISEVKEFVRETFDCYNEDYDEDDETTDGDPSDDEDYDEDDENTDGDPSPVTALDQAWNEQCHSEDSETGVDELDRYLKDRPVPRTDSFNILNWWKVNSSNYPKVARMARDALAIPTSNRLSSEQISMIRNGIRADI